MPSRHDNAINPSSAGNKTGSVSGGKLPTIVKLLRFLIAPTFLVLSQLYNALTLKHVVRDVIDAPVIHKDEKNFTNPSFFDPIPRLAKNESFGACLMIKEDNDLLYEWLSYHYTILPLRYVFIGSDEGNLQDPEEVLERWKLANTGLEYWIQNSSSFMHRHGKWNGSENDNDNSHNSFIHRQRSFITTCTEFMKAQGLHWVIFTDSDEFLVMNRLGKGENLTIGPSKEPHAVDQTTFKMRHALPHLDSKASVLDTIFESNKIKNLSPCVTMPRVLFGALENVSCSDAQAVDKLVKSSFRYEEMSTLRFKQHARKGDFSVSKWGKVMMDVSNLSDATIAERPRNIHRPYKPECRSGALLFSEAIFSLNHYIGSWERYDSRQDDRRNRQEWEKRAHISLANSCDQAIFQWFPRFLETVGIERAKFLLGVEEQDIVPR